MVPGDDGSGDRDGDRERRAAAADQRPGLQRHGPARQQHPGQGGDLGDDQPASTATAAAVGRTFSACGTAAPAMTPITTHTAATTSV